MALQGLTCCFFIFPVFNQVKIAAQMFRWDINYFFVQAVVNVLQLRSNALCRGLLVLPSRSEAPKGHCGLCSTVVTLTITYLLYGKSLNTKSLSLNGGLNASLLRDTFIFFRGLV